MEDKDESTLSNKRKDCKMLLFWGYVPLYHVKLFI